MSNARGSEHMLNRVMTKDNIALAALLETKPAVWEQSQLPAETESQHQQILVCTAHIHWDPEFCDVKLIQVYNVYMSAKRASEDIKFKNIYIFVIVKPQ